MNRKIFLLLVLICSLPLAAQMPADYVNPFIGASTNTEAAGAFHGLGKTFPGATTPFGMTQVSPQTITGGDNGSGYSDEHKTIEGFAMTQMSGIGWYGDLGNFMVMPTNGSKLYTSAGKEDGTKGWRSHYDKQSEIARAGYYSTMLTDYGIRVETTASTHGGVLRITYPQNPQSRIQIDLARRVGGTASEEQITVVDDHTLEGWMRCTPDGGGWGDGAGGARYTVFFHAELSRPMEDYGFWSAEIPEGQKRHNGDVASEPYQQMLSKAKIIRGEKSLQGPSIGFFAQFPTLHSEQVELKVAISFVDLDGARRNFEAELCKKNFEQVRREAYDAWNNALDRISVEGGSANELTIFYTALYHTMIDPRIYTDVDGRYVGGDYKIHQSNKNFQKRTIFSGWDVFRSQFPLQTLINPQVVTDMLQSLTTMAEQSGRQYFERWEFLNSYTGCMIGNPAISVLADAVAKGLDCGDIEKAYQYAKNSSVHFGNDKLGFSTDISKTLEYAYTDWCIAQLAKCLGKKDDEKSYLAKSQAWQLIWDKEKKWFRPRREDGSWNEWPKEGRLRHDYGCIESNPLQQGWFVPHDVQGMTRTMGGKKAVLKDLQWMFEQTPKNMLWNDYYNHANEPVHFIPYLFNQVDAPWLTQYWTRFICANAYKNKVEGLCGNEDVGQMSAWYVLSASGIHQACPGDTRFEITSPVFQKVSISVGEGKTFTIIAHENSPQNVYIQNMRLNGETYNKSWIDYSDIIRGGTLELFMGSTPRTKGWKR